MSEASPLPCSACPTCHSEDPRTARSGCYNPWHQGLIVHFQLEPAGSPSTEGHAVCSAPIDDGPSQLAVGLEFVSCPACLAIVPTCVGCGDALTEVSRAPLEAWCVACHAQNMADPVDYDALGSVAREALDARAALSEALDMLDGHDDGRACRVAALRSRFALPFDPALAARRTREWAVKERSRSRPVLEVGSDGVATAYRLELPPRVLRQLAEYAVLEIARSSDGEEIVRVDINTRPFVLCAGGRCPERGLRTIMRNDNPTTRDAAFDMEESEWSHLQDQARRAGLELTRPARGLPNDYEVTLRARWIGPSPRVGDYLMAEVRPRSAYRVDRVTAANFNVCWDTSARAEVRQLRLDVTRVERDAVPAAARVHSWRGDRRAARSSHVPSRGEAPR